jgi:hypothetical protein
MAANHVEVSVMISDRNFPYQTLKIRKVSIVVMGS